MSQAHEPRPEDLEVLASKYATLGELRRKHAAGQPPPDTAVLRELAAAFPGSLRELDRFPLEEIDRRRAALYLAAAGGPIEPWMRWLFGYHGVLRAALYVKTRRGASRAAALDVSALATAASAHAGYPIDSALVEELMGRVTDKRGPRLVTIAVTAVATRFGVTSSRVRAALLLKNP